MTTDVLKNTITVNDDNFDSEVINSNVPVLVDFWAEWCGPCRIIGPTIEAIADDYQGAVKVAKLNVDDNPHSARRFGIQSIPTLIVFENGEARESIVGVRPKGQLTELLDKYVH